VDGSPGSAAQDAHVLNAGDYAVMRKDLEEVHNNMHVFVFMGSPHIAFRDPFVFLLHSNVDRLFARWQTELAHPERLDPSRVYGTESNLDVVVVNVTQNLNHNIEPWSTGHSFDQFGGRALYDAVVCP
jgi:Common central domain of tyrosinase